MAQFSVILAAAGSSSRFQGFHLRKPFVSLRGIPVWQRALAAFRSRDDVAQFLMAVAPEDRPFLESGAGGEMEDISLVNGGRTRADSVYNALALVRPPIDFVAVHDAARPLIMADGVAAVFAAAMRTGAAIPALPVASTIKEIGDDGRISRTVDRAELYLAQTPQVFSRHILEDAFRVAGEHRGNFTDDAALVEAAGHPVTIVEGWPENIKITTAGDLRIAEALLDS